MDTTAGDSLTLPRFQALLPSSGSRGPWAVLLRRIRRFGVEHLSDAAPRSRLVGSADGDHPRQVVHGVGALVGGEVVDGGAQAVGGPYAVGAHAAHNTRSDANGRTAGVEQVNGLPDVIPLREALPKDIVEQESSLTSGRTAATTVRTSNGPPTNEDRSAQSVNARHIANIESVRHEPLTGRTRGARVTRRS